MAANDLGTPLGKKPPRPKRRLPAPVLPVIGGVIAFAAAAFVWVNVRGNSNGGEPFTVVTIDKPAAKQAERATPAAADPATGARTEDASGKTTAGRTITIIDGKSGERREVTLKDGDGTTEPPAAGTKAAAAGPAVDTRLVENSRYGPIPRVAADGTRPLDAYASAAAQTADRRIARIAIVVGGLGISSSTTREAIATLPGSITLAFAPYGNDLAKLAMRARATGHEIVLQLPMEPFDYPDNDPGPQTLLTSVKPEQNLDRLHWMLSRIQGYVGVTNYMGARFTTTDQALTPVLRDIGKRGLLYLDDGSSPRNAAAQAAAAVKAPFLKADLVVDAAPGWAGIDAALARLEALAADKGFAIGTATALPVSLERIARWAKAAQARGIQIVPLSAILPKAKQS